MLDNNHVVSQEKRSGLAVCQAVGGVASLLRTAATQVGSCGAPSPPAPSGNCCFYSAASCSAGQTCCSGSGKSYASASTCKQYGAKHGCVWADGTCAIPSSVLGSWNAYRSDQVGDVVGGLSQRAALAAQVEAA